MRFRLLVKGVPLFVFLRGMPVYLRNYSLIKKHAESDSREFPFWKMHPCV